MVDLKKVSRGKLEVSENLELTATKDIVSRNMNSANGSGHGKKKKPMNKRKRKTFKKRK